MALAQSKKPPQRGNAEAKGGCESIKAFIYGRYSDHRQKDTSIEQQFREIREHCQREKITIVGEYADRALSGKTDKRPEFQRMIHDCSKGRVDLVICWKVDRFARNRYDAATYKARLKKYGVKVIYVKEYIPDTPEGILLEAVLEGSAEYYSANLAQNIQRGMRENALQCKVNNGALPLGYRKGPDGKFTIDPAGAAIVKDIFEMYTGGMKAVEICADLNSRGPRTAHGAQFNKNSLRSILKNERYIGVYQYAEVRIEGGVPAIITKEMYDMAQEAIKKRAKAPAASWAEANYLLTGKLFCGLCGSSMIGESGTSHTGTKHNYYTCSARKRQKACDKKPVKKDWIEEYVARAVAEYALTDEMIDLISTNAVELQRQERESGELPALKAQLKDVERRRKNVYNAIEQGIASRTLQEGLAGLEEQAAQLKDNIYHVEVQYTNITKEDLTLWLEHFRSGDVKDPAYQETLINAFITAVYVYDDHLKIVIRYAKDKKDEITLSFVDGVDSGGDGSAFAIASPPCNSP